MLVEINPNTHITKNFTFEELANNQAIEDVKAIYNDDIRLFAEMLQELRNWYAKPIKVNSWYRTKTFNKTHGGDKNSLHLKGLAMDWGVKHTKKQHTNVQDKWAEICAAHNVIGGINHYTNGYHLSIHEEQFGHSSFVVRDYRGKKGDW